MTKTWITWSFNSTSCDSPSLLLIYNATDFLGSEPTIVKAINILLFFCSYHKSWKHSGNPHKLPFHVATQPCSSQHSVNFTINLATINCKAHYCYTMWVPLPLKFTNNRNYKILWTLQHISTLFSLTSQFT